MRLALRFPQHGSRRSEGDWPRGAEVDAIASLSPLPDWQPFVGPPLLLPLENKDDWFVLIGMMLCLRQRLKIGRKLEVVGALDHTLQLVRHFETAIADPVSGRQHVRPRIRA